MDGSIFIKMTNEGIIIFKDIFEYYKEGELNAKQFSELMMLIYSTRWEDKVIEDKDIKDTKIRLIWKTLKHSVIKSKNNSKVDNQPIQDEVIIVPEGERTRLPKDEYGKKMWSLMKMADENRVKATKAEKAAKDYLQKKGLKFVFQKPIIANMNGYIADFYFPDTKLILEIDGGYHEDFEQRKADIKRTKDLNTEGIKVVRMKNEDVYDFNYPKEIFKKAKKKVVS